MKDATAKEYSIELSLKGKVVKSVKTTPYSVDSNKTLYYANLTNLITNTTYSYAIVSSDKQRSKAITFTTFESGNKEYTVFVNSDIHNRSSMLSHMMNYGKKANAALYCLLGDNVGNSIDNPYKDIMGGFLTDVSHSTLGKYPIIILRGNHEIRGKKLICGATFSLMKIIALTIVYV
jgi:hypothetical protein